MTTVGYRRTQSVQDQYLGTADQTARGWRYRRGVRDIADIPKAIAVGYIVLPMADRQRCHRQALHREWAVVRQLYEIEIGDHSPTNPRLRLDQVEKDVGNYLHILLPGIDRDPDLEEVGPGAQVVQPSDGVKVGMGYDHRVNRLDAVVREPTQSRLIEGFTGINHDIADRAIVLFDADQQRGTQASVWGVLVQRVAAGFTGLFPVDQTMDVGYIGGATGSQEDNFYWSCCHRLVRYPEGQNPPKHGGAFIRYYYQ